MSAVEYHSKAVQFAAKARVEANPTLQSQYGELATLYLRLAIHADVYQETNTVLASHDASDGAFQQQQQQQVQPDKNKNTGDD
jgi:hypothetical protein